MIICDFCSDTKVVKSYKCADFATAVATNKETLIIRSDGMWAACQICADMIDNNRWDELKQRSMETSGLADSPLRAAMEAYLDELHGGFRRMRTKIN
jgi:hypothetical protein